ncbi:MAG TPA: ABC transporter ATP-binding protein [Vicinamibacterales bacterium]|nr:ABC transporter ATP-binding protein [Vicinamibacterales bacterium]
MASIALERIEKVFPGGHEALRHFSLEIPDGEFMVLVGPSGSGKSTALRIIAGLETPTAGRVLIGGVDVTAVPPQKRDLAMVFQSYALYPHKTVRENLAFGLRMRGAAAGTIEERVAEVSRALQVEALLDRRPAQLSGGQRQRVALGRAMVRSPRAFLFDEPLSNLDPALRGDTRAELSILHARLRATMVYVTHDQEEAMTLGTRIAVLDNGVLQQVAPPRELYERPANVFVARFVGSPPMNLLRGTGQIPAGISGLDPSTAVLGIRPHDLAIAATDEADVMVMVEVVETLGHQLHLRCRTESPDPAPIVVATAADRAVAAGDRLPLRMRRDRVHRFDPATGRRLESASGGNPG